MSELEDVKLDNAIDSVIDSLINYSIPLYLDRNNQPIHFGTGFFVHKGGHYFLISAAHVLDKALSHGLYFYSSPSKKCHLTGHLIRSGSEINRKDDHTDIGVVKLSNKIQPPFRDVQKFAMDISYLQPCYLPRSNKHYVFVGFPATKTRVVRKDKSIRVTPYAYNSDSVTETDYEKHKVNPETHVILSLKLKKCFNQNKDVVNFPKPQGMSGSPVVVLYEQEDGGSRTFPVVAVAIEYRKMEKIVIATDVKYVLEAIKKVIQDK